MEKLLKKHRNLKEAYRKARDDMQDNFFEIIKKIPNNGEVKGKIITKEATLEFDYVSWNSMHADIKFHGVNKDAPYPQNIMPFEVSLFDNKDIIDIKFEG